MFEDSTCRRCPLWKTSPHVCLVGSGRTNSGARILVLLDYPNQLENRMNRPMSGEGTKLLIWMFARMGLSSDDYYLEYTAKCTPPDGKLPNNKAHRMQIIEACSIYRHATLQIGAFPVVVGLGRLSCEALTGSHEINKYQGTFWTPTEAATRQFSNVVWIGPNVNAVLMNPAIAGELYRVIWAAALQANYNPQTTQIPPFDWSDFIK